MKRGLFFATKSKNAFNQTFIQVPFRYSYFQQMTNIVNR